jgi:hypothetical protein
MGSSLSSPLGPSSKGGPGLALGVMLIALLGGCGGASPVTIKVTAPENANGGRPVYMLVRTVDDATFAADSYGSVAPKVVAPDSTVIKYQVIYPSSAPVIEVNQPEKGEVGVYFFFTNPTAEWKTLVKRPFSKKVEIALGQDQIVLP